MGLRSLVVRAREIVREYKMITVAELAYALDKSLTYTKYSIVPVLVEIERCIEYNEKGRVLRWTCDGERELEAEAAVRG